MGFPHPLQDLAEVEVTKARDLILQLHPNKIIEFRQIGLQEPKKAELAAFLRAEHANEDLNSIPRPPRQARCHYDILSPAEKQVQYHEVIIDVEKEEVVDQVKIDPKIEPGLTLCVYKPPVAGPPLLTSLGQW